MRALMYGVDPEVQPVPETDNRLLQMLAMDSVIHRVVMSPMSMPTINGHGGFEEFVHDVLSCEQ